MGTKARVFFRRFRALDSAGGSIYIPITRYRVKKALAAAQRPREPHLWLHRTPTMAAGLSDHTCCHGLSGHRYQRVKTVACLIIGTLPKRERGGIFGSCIWGGAKAPVGNKSSKMKFTY